MSRFRQPLPAERWLPALVAFAVPGIVVLALLVAFGGLDPGAAALGFVLLLIGVGLTVWRVFGDLWQVVHYASALVSEPERPAPVPARSLIAGDIIDAVSRLHRGLTAGQARLSAEAEAETAILDALPDPLFLLDGERRILRANAAVRALVGDDPAGRDLAQALRHPTVLEVAATVLGRRAAGAEAEFTLLGARPREFAVRAVALSLAAGGGMGGAAALLTLRDLTAAKRAEQMRADFVANASHELRTPLSALIGFIETLRGPAREDAEARERFLAIMSEQAGRMARLIADLLSLSQIELDEHLPPQGQVDLAALVRDVAETLQLKAGEKEMRIIIEAAPGLPAVPGDRDQLIQVMQNLLDNALKYGRRGSEVRVDLTLEPQGSARGTGVKVAVRDRGEGIAREHLPRLTERFYRVEPARSRALGGTGLGLAIVKHIVNRHRGTFLIESRVGEGSCFTVCLPAAPAGEGVTKL